MTSQTVITLVILFASGAWAQATCGYGFLWSENSLGQDPCHFGSLLDASCRDLSVYPYSVLSSGESYPAPEANRPGDLTCDCNTVMYSINMACALCQGAQIYSWSSWALQCETVDISKYPVPIAQGTLIPYWAFYNVTSLPSEQFDQNVATNVGRYPEASPTATSTTGLSSPTSTGDSSGTGLGSNTLGIIGGSVGTVILIKIILISLCCRRRKRRRQVMETTQYMSHTTQRLVEM